MNKVPINSESVDKGLILKLPENDVFSNEVELKALKEEEVIVLVLLALDDLGNIAMFEQLIELKEFFDVVLILRTQSYILENVRLVFAVNW